MPSTHRIHNVSLLSAAPLPSPLCLLLLHLLPSLHLLSLLPLTGILSHQHCLIESQFHPVQNKLIIIINNNDD